MGRAKPGEARQYLVDIVFTYEGDDCLIWPYARNSAGYGHIAFCGRDSLVHRLACIEENGAAPSGEHEAAHSCGKGHLGCCNKKHTRWATSAENAVDRFTHGTVKFGEKHYAAKLTESDVRFIRQSDLNNTELAAKFDVNRTNILAVRKMKSWRHVQ